MKPNTLMKIKKLNREIDFRGYKDDIVINLLKDIIILQQKEIDEIDKILNEVIKKC